MKKLEARLGYVFTDKILYRQALTHSSYGYEQKKPHNERLEFLGDAILGMAIAEQLYQRHPDVDEGVLSKQKSAIVSEETLVKKAEHLQLGRLLLLGKGEDRSGGRLKPSILSDAVEALIGAVSRDGGFQAALDLIFRLFEDELSQELLVLKNDQDFKSLLQERTQKLGLGFPNYKAIKISGPEHDRSFTFRIEIGDQHGPCGSGSSKKRAQQECARKALADEAFWETLEGEQ